MGSDAKNLMSDENVQIVKAGEIISATQLAEGKLIVEAGEKAGNTVVTGVGQLKVAAGGITECARYGNNDTLSVNDDAIATNTVRSEGGATSLSTLATVNGHHPEGEFSIDKGYACGLLLENDGNLRALESHRTEEIILDQEGGLLVSGTTSAIVVDEGSGLLVYPGGEVSNCETNQDGVSMLAGEVNDTLFAGGAMNNLGDENSDTIVENGAICRLGTDGLQFYSSGKTQNLSVSVGGQAEVHAGTLENAIIQDGTVILLSPANADEDFVVEEDRVPVELAGSVALLDGALIVIGHGAGLQQLTITVQQGGVLILNGSMVKDDSVTFGVGSINLNGGRLWLITDVATQVHPKVKRLREEGAICLQTSAEKVSSDFINVKGEVTGDAHVEITNASRQTLCNALKLQPDEDGIGATLQPA